MFKKPRNDACYYYLKDHLGNIRMTLDENRSVKSAQDYFPYGKLSRSYDNSDNNGIYKFTEKERDNETNYDYFGARYYNNDLGVWLQIDPLADKYPGWSPYNFVMGNPLKYIDPDGNQVNPFTIRENGVGLYINYLFKSDPIPLHQRFLDVAKDNLQNAGDNILDFAINNRSEIMFFIDGVLIVARVHPVVATVVTIVYLGVEYQLNEVNEFDTGMGLKTFADILIELANKKTKVPTKHITQSLVEYIFSKLNDSNQDEKEKPKDKKKEEKSDPDNSQDNNTD